MSTHVNPEHCGTPMVCLTWAGKRNGRTVYWCERCGAVLVRDLKLGKATRPDLVLVPKQRGTDEVVRGKS